MPTGQPAGDRIIWGDANEKHLLLCILAEANPQKLDWAKIVERFGPGLSAGAASQKYGKIKTRDKALFEGGGGSGSASNGVSKATPAKKSKSKSTTPAAKRKSGYSAKDMGKGYGPNPLDGLDMEREEDEEIETPMKKVKMEREIDSGIDDEY